MQAPFHMLKRCLARNAALILGLRPTRLLFGGQCLCQASDLWQKNPLAHFWLLVQLWKDSVGAWQIQVLRVSNPNHGWCFTIKLVSGFLTAGFAVIFWLSYGYNPGFVRDGVHFFLATEFYNPIRMCRDENGTRFPCERGFIYTTHTRVYTAKSSRKTSTDILYTRLAIDKCRSM